MRSGRKEPDHEAKHQARVWGVRPHSHLGGFVTTGKTGVVSNICCADVVAVGAKEETSDLGLILEAEVLAHYRAGLR